MKLFAVYDTHTKQYVSTSTDKATWATPGAAKNAMHNMNHPALRKPGSSWRDRLKFDEQSQLEVREVVLVQASEMEDIEDMRNDSDFLNCLRNAGVDNWDGYEFALEEFQSE